MTDLIVIMGATEVHGTLPLYREQIFSAGIELKIIDCSDKPNINGGGNLGYRVALFRKYATEYSERKFIIFSDAFDVTFYGASAKEIMLRMPREGLLHAAEKNCYPDKAIAERIAGGPWRFANGGLVAGSPKAYIEWCDFAESHPLYVPTMLDQQFLNILVAERSPFAKLDTLTRMFFCLYGGYDELQFENGKPVNALYGTRPLFVHANGKWTADEMFDRQKRSLA